MSDLTKYEARRIAANIAKLPELIREPQPFQAAARASIVAQRLRVPELLAYGRRIAAKMVKLPELWPHIQLLPACLARYNALS